MTDDTPAYSLWPRKARELEKKGFATFQDLWDTSTQSWAVEDTRWIGLKPKEQDFLLKVIDKIKPTWPTSPLATLEPSIKQWKIRTGSRRPTQHKPWILRLATAWCKDNCFITSEVCRKKLKACWSATGSNRLNMLLWRILSRKLPIKGITCKWGLGSPMCPRCFSRVESLRHALWDCPNVLPLWKKCSRLLESSGFTERISWKLLGCKGRMNPDFLKIWQFIRAYMLDKIWLDRNLIAHQKPSMGLEPSLVKSWILEACSLAKLRKGTSTQASIMSKKIGRA